MGLQWWSRLILKGALELGNLQSCSNGGKRARLCILLSLEANFLKEHNHALGSQRGPPLRLFLVELGRGRNERQSGMLTTASIREM